MKCDCKKLMGGFCEPRTVKCNREWCAKFLSEFIGMFFFLFFGCLSCVSPFWNSRETFEMIFNFVNAILLSVHCFCNVSGCHINPSVSLAACLMNVITWDAMLLYWLFQILGSAAGFALLAISIPSAATKVEPGLCITDFPSISIPQAFAVEFCLTFLLALYCCAIWSSPSNQFHDSLPARILFLILALVYAGVHHTSASLNFARSLGPALYYLHFQHFYVYVIATLLGGILAPIVWNLLWSKDMDDGEEK